MGKRKNRLTGTASPLSTTVTPEPKRSSQQMTPKPQRLSYTSDNTMAATRPKMIRTLNDEIIKDRCVLTELLDTLCHDKTSTVRLYEYSPLKCHTEGLKEYKTH